MAGRCVRSPTGRRHARPNVATRLDHRRDGKSGPQFCSEFSRAYLDPLQAADIGRVPVSGRRIHECSYHIQSARERAWAALEAVGGLASPGGCCIWSVVGGERKLKEWALQQGWNGRRISEESASRILISALGSLAGSYDA